MNSIQDDIEKYILNKSQIAIKLNYFNPSYIYYDIISCSSQFINLTYKSPSLHLDGLTFQTPWMKVINNITDVQYNSEMMYLELTFTGIENDCELELFYNSLQNLDNYNYNIIKKYIPNIQGSKFYNKTLKKNEKTDAIKYNYIKIKLPIDIKDIVVNNSRFNGDIKTINFTNSYCKCVIVSNGLWKYNNIYGLSWKVVKLYVNTEEKYNDENEIFEFDEDMPDCFDDV